MTSLPAKSLVSSDQQDADAATMRILIAQELDQVRLVLEDMGAQLCEDPQVVHRHFALLQAIDELCQRNENLSRTLRAGNMVEAIADITLESLRARLLAALAAERKDRSIDPG